MPKHFMNEKANAKQPVLFSQPPIDHDLSSNASSLERSPWLHQENYDFLSSLPHLATFLYTIMPTWLLIYTVTRLSEYCLFLLLENHEQGFLSILLLAIIPGPRTAPAL